MEQEDLVAVLPVPVCVPNLSVFSRLSALHLSSGDGLRSLFVAVHGDLFIVAFVPNWPFLASKEPVSHVLLKLLVILDDYVVSQNITYLVKDKNSIFIKPRCGNT